MRKAKTLAMVLSLCVLDGKTAPTFNGSLACTSDFEPVLRTSVGGEARARSELLAELRAGTFTGPLVVEARTYIQRPTPNRNFVRFKSGTLRAGAKTFRNMPVLVDHDQRSVAARIGTIVDSRAEKVGEDVVFFQTLSIVKLSAIEGVLDGTIDRFSIGWMPTGTIECSVHKKPMFGPGCCSCWPGVETEDGKMPEAVFTAWEGIEVSAVNVPAVVGTGIDQVRSALAMLRDGASNKGGEQPQEKLKMDIRMMLGLPPTATDDEVKAALSALQNSASEAEAAKTRLKTSRIDSAIAAAYADGRLEVVRDSNGKQVASAFESQLRALDNADTIESMLSAMPKRVSVPVSPTQLDSAKKPAPVINNGKQSGAVTPALEAMLPHFGLDVADVEKFGPHNRVAQRASKMPVPAHLSKLFATRYSHTEKDII